MFKTEVDLSDLSAHATVRWKRCILMETDRTIPKVEHRRVRSLITSSNPAHFLNLSLNTTEEFTKVSKQEDLKEIALQLSFLRKKHDVNKGSNYHHDTDLLRLKRKVDNYNQEEAKTISLISELKLEIEKLEISIIEVTQKQEEALSAANVYKHILERMRKARIFLDIKNEDFVKDLKINGKLLQEEVEVLRKVKESKIKTKEAHTLLVEYKEKVTTDKVEKLEAISKDLNQRQEYNRKREERYKRQIDIAEAAANEHKDMSDTQMRESLMTHRFWFLYLDKRHTHDMKKFDSTERAFEKVRKIAGVSNASEMVTKFLTAEFAYSDLKRAVDDSRGRIEETKEKIEEIEEKIQNMEQLKIQTSTIDSMKKEMILKLKIISKDRERLMKLKTVQEKIRAWSEKNLKRFGENCEGLRVNEPVLVLRNCVKGVMEKIKIVVRAS